MWMLFWQLASVFAYSLVHTDHFSTHSSQSVHAALTGTHPRHHNFFLKVLRLAKMTIHRVWFWELSSICQCIVLSYLLLKLKLRPWLHVFAHFGLGCCGPIPQCVGRSHLIIPLCPSGTNEVVEVGQRPANPCETYLFYYSTLYLLVLFDFLLSYGKNHYILDIIFFLGKYFTNIHDLLK